MYVVLRCGLIITACFCKRTSSEVTHAHEWLAGPCDGNQREGIPFIIEWIPDVLPQSHVGEMRIQFEFGHQYNGVVQHRPPTTTAAHGSFMQQIPALSTANG